MTLQFAAVRGVLVLLAMSCSLQSTYICAQSAQSVTRITGTVVDDHARPVAGAAVGVLLTRAVAGFQSERPDAMLHVLTDARGRFALVIPRSLRTVSLVARASGMAPSRPSALVLSSGAKDVGTLGLRVGLSVTGRVSDEQRKPVPGATIRATSEEVPDDTTPARFRNSVVSDAAGRFRILGVERGEYTLVAQAPPLVTRYLRRRTSGAAAEAFVEITLFAPTYLSGQVFDTSGAPVAGARLTATAGEDPAAHTSSNGQGQFQLGPFARGSKLEFRAAAAGFAPMRTDDLVSPATDVMVRLSRNGTLRGRVVELGSGRAVLDFEVLFLPKPPLLSMGSSGSRVFHTADGRFEWREVFAGTWRASIRAPGYQTLVIPGLAIPPGNRTQELLFEVQKGVTLRGRVIDRASGSGIVGAAVSCSASEVPWSDKEDGVSACSARTDVSGSFAIANLPPQSLALTVNATGYSPAQRTVVAADDTAVDVLLDPGASIAGRLVAPDSVTPLAGMVSLQWREASLTRATDKDGAFYFGDLPAGAYEISAEAASGRVAPLPISVQPGRKIEDLVLTLDRGGILRGTIAGLMPGERGRVRVSVQASSGFTAQARPDELGLFEVQGVPKGGVAVVVSTALERQLTRHIEMPEKGTATVDVVFPAGHRVSGRVTRAGQPARFVKLLATPADNQGTEAEAESTQAGQYVFEGLARGDYLIAVSGALPVSYTVSGDSTLNIDLPALSVAGVVTNATDGRPLEGVQVELRSDGGESAIRVAADSNFQGSFELLGLEAGEYRLSAYKSGYDLAEQLVTLTSSGPPITVPLMPSAGVRIRALDAATRAPLGEVMVIEMLGARNGHRIDVPLDAEGVGRLPPYLAGHDLVISWLGYAARPIGRWNGLPLDVSLEREAR